MRQFRVLWPFLVAQLLLIGTAAAADGPLLLDSFHFGSASAPFAGATALADFNGDGVADVAVADKSIASPGVYTLTVAVSKETGFHETFYSGQRALLLRVADVDGDNDLDILLAVPVTATPVRLWLNDGRGAFSSADVRLAARTRAPGRAAASAEPNRTVECVALTQRDLPLERPPDVFAARVNIGRFSLPRVVPAPHVELISTPLRAPPIGTAS